MWAELRGTRMLKVSFGRIKANGASETEEQRKDRLRIRRKKKIEQKETEDHKKQCLATLKILKQGDKN